MVESNDAKGKLDGELKSSVRFMDYPQIYFTVTINVNISFTVILAIGAGRFVLLSAKMSDIQVYKTIKSVTAEVVGGVSD